MINEPSPQSHEELLARIEALEKQNKTLASFLASLASELRTPTNSVLGFSRFLLSGDDGVLTDVQIQDVKAIEQAGKKLQDLANGMLNSSRLMYPASFYGERITLPTLIDRFIVVSQERLIVDYGDSCAVEILAEEYLLADAIRLIMEVLDETPQKQANLSISCDNEQVKLSFSCKGQRLRDNLIEQFQVSATEFSLLEDWFSEIYNLRFAHEVAKRHDGQLEIIHGPETDTVIEMQLPIYTEQPL